MSANVIGSRHSMYRYMRRVPYRLCILAGLWLINLCYAVTGASSVVSREIIILSGSSSGMLIRPRLLLSKKLSFSLLSMGVKLSFKVSVFWKYCVLSM